MKQIFTTLIIAITGNIYSQAISQNQVPNTVQNGTSLACKIPQTNFTSANSYIRAFRLQEFGITSDFTISNVAFGVEGVSGSFPVGVRLFNLNGQFPGGAMNAMDVANVNVSPTNNLGMVNTGTDIGGVIPAGGAFVIEIFHNGANTNPRQGFFMGSHPGNQMRPSYLVAPGCNINNPTATGTGALANNANARWVMTITGQSAVLGVTEVINSQDLQIYPNPVKDIVRFRFSNNLKSEGIDVYDMNGRIIISVQNNKNVNELNMSSYPKGNYILKVKTDDGKIYVQKIIKE